MIVPRRFLLLGFIILALASNANADDSPRVMQSEEAESDELLLEPEEPSPLEPRPMMAARARSPRMDQSFRQSRYIAQHPRSDEPLGFSNTLFSESGSPVDPADSPGIFEEEPFDASYDPTDPDAPAPTISSGEWIGDGCWYAQQSAVFMSRSTNPKNSVILSTDTSSVPSATLIHYRTFLQVPLDMGYQPGLRSTWGRYLGRDDQNREHAVEFTFLGLTHWQTAASLTAHSSGGIFSEMDPTFAVPAFNASDSQSFSQTSSFNSYELNYRINRRLARDKMIYTRDSTWVRQCSPAPLPSIFAGIRVLTINESLRYLAQSSSATGSYNVQTHNNLVGLQIGTDWFYERYEWRLGARVKGGGFVNWDSQNSQVRVLDLSNVPLVPNRDEHAKNHPLAFAGEWSFLGEYRFRPNFAFRASYDLMWVTNLALAQNQLTFAPSTPALISSSHSLFFQGVSVGFELSR